MSELITLGYLLKIHLANGTTIDISRFQDNTDEPINYATGINVKESVYQENQNPIGVLSSGTVKVNIVSLDRSLVPENKNSIYFGYMNSTAEIEVGTRIKTANSYEDVYFGRYYVSTWTSKAASDSKYKVEINGTDILGIITKNSVPSLDIKRNISTVDVLNDINEKMNLELGDKYKFKFNFLTTPKHNLLATSDIEANDISTLLNTVCQSTLLNMYVDRSTDKTNRLVNVLDTTVEMGEKEADLSDSKEITNSSLEKGALVGYTGVKVNYSLYSVNNSSEIANLGSISLNPGDNTIENISIGGAVFKINTVKVTTNSDVAVDIKSITYNRRTASLVITNNTSEKVDCALSITGQTLNENNLSVIRKSVVDSNEMLEVNNKILHVNKINLYANDLLKSVNNRGETLEISGIFDPRKIKLNTIVYVDCSKSIYVENKYRVAELDWTLGGVLKCKAKLIK